MWRSRMFWQLFGTYGLLIVLSVGLLGFVVGSQAERAELAEIEKSLRDNAMLLQEVIRNREIEGNRLVYYPWQVFVPPAGSTEVYRFGCVSVMEYAGDNLWSFQEDLYTPREAEQVLKRWLADGGKLPGRRG